MVRVDVGQDVVLVLCSKLKSVYVLFMYRLWDPRFPSSVSPQFLSFSISFAKFTRRLSHTIYSQHTSLSLSLSTFWWVSWDRGRENHRNPQDIRIVVTSIAFFFYSLHLPETEIFADRCLVLLTGNGFWNVRWNFANCGYFSSDFGFFLDYICLGFTSEDFVGGKRWILIYCCCS